MSATTTTFPTAVIFDAYGTLFDVHSVIAAAEWMFPGHGNALSQLWRQKQIEYTQLRTLADPGGAHYAPFWDITLDALRFAATRLHLTLDAGAQKRLMDEYACLSAYPDAVPALRALHQRRLADAAHANSQAIQPTAQSTAQTATQAATHAAAPTTSPQPASAAAPLVPGLAILSNGNPQMLDIAVKSAGMTGLFDHVLSVDSVRAYKPAAAAYALGTAAFAAAAREIVFVSSNGWDIAGATWFGYRTFWLNRLNAPLEELDVAPHASGASMNDLLEFLNSPAQAGRAGKTGKHGSTDSSGGRRPRHGPGA